MAVNENDPLHAGNQPGQQPPGYKQQATSLDHEGEQNAYGQDHDATNHNRDLQYVNAAHQPSQSQPDFKAQGRDGQHPNDPPRTGNQEPDPRRQEDDDDDNDQKVIPEVPLRREEREKQIPKADPNSPPNPGNPEEIDRPGPDENGQFPIDDSSKFSE